MSIILYLIGISLMLGLGGLGLFMWSLRHGQFDDLEGAARRVLFDDMDEAQPAANPGPMAPAPMVPGPMPPAQMAIVTRPVDASK